MFAGKIESLAIGVLFNSKTINWISAAPPDILNYKNSLHSQQKKVGSSYSHQNNFLFLNRLCGGELKTAAVLSKSTFLNRLCGGELFQDICSTVFLVSKPPLRR